MFKKALLSAAAVLSLWQASTVAQAAETLVAVAANFTAPAKEIATAFEAETGHQAVLSFGSTGKLYAQVVHGAPFTVFLAADSARPEKLENEGKAVAGSRFTYAKGTLVLYSPSLPSVTLDTLTGDSVSRIALANPKTAPYGAAAEQVMAKYGQLTTLRPKLVRGENIAQTFQFVSTGNAQAGFVALSQVIKASTGSRWDIPARDYSPIAQQAVLLNKGAADEAAQAFLAFLKGAKAKAIIAAYGYGTE